MSLTVRMVTDLYVSQKAGYFLTTSATVVSRGIFFCMETDSINSILLHYTVNCVTDDVK
jgi:hypothetical protein